MSLLPALGLEGAGEIVALCYLVTGLKIGDRVTWGWAKNTYAKHAAISRDSEALIPVGHKHPSCNGSHDGVHHRSLARTGVHQAQSGHTALVHSDSGGVGLILCQTLSAHGVRAIGTVSNSEQEEIAQKDGASEVIRDDRVDFVADVYEITQREKCEVFYAEVGGSTFEGSLQCLKSQQISVLFGAARGAVPPFDLQQIGDLGSQVTTHATIAHFISSKDELPW